MNRRPKRDQNLARHAHAIYTPHTAEISIGTQREGSGDPSIISSLLQLSHIVVTALPTFLTVATVLELFASTCSTLDF